MAQPHRGDRHLVASRLPRNLADVVLAEAKRQGLSYSEYIARVLADAHGIQLPTADTGGQEALPISA